QRPVQGREVRHRPGGRPDDAVAPPPGGLGVRADRAVRARLPQATEAHRARAAAGHAEGVPRPHPPGGLRSARNEAAGGDLLHVIWLWIVVGIVVLLALAGIVSYNRFVSQRNLIRNAWANIDTELRRRYDLIPNLVETRSEERRV